MSMTDQINAYAAAAGSLEPDEKQRAMMAEQVLAYSQQFLTSLADRPAYVPSDENGRALYDSPIGETGIEMDAALSLLDAQVNTPGVNPASPRFLGYIPGGGLYHSALGDYLAAVGNRYAGVFYASPGAVRVENMLWNWMADEVGYPATRAGNLTSGGSIANLSAIVTARDAHGIQGTEVARAVIYMTAQVHHSVGKAINIAGLSTAHRRIIPVDQGYRMDAAALEAAVAADRQAGLNPFLIIASAGTTNTGAVDPLDHIADIARAHNMWFHVDGAYGGFFTLCEQGKAALAGMERSDSLTMDPHKTLFLPYGTGALLVRDRQQLYAAHHGMADYMQDILDADEELSPADLSPELTRHFRGLRLWLPLKLLGVAPFRAGLAEKILLTQLFHQRLEQIPGFEVGPHPELSVTVYRCLPKRGDANAFNKRLVEAVNQEGRIFISSTMLDGAFTLRLAVGVYSTHLDVIEETLEILTRAARQLETAP